MTRFGGRREAGSGGRGLTDALAVSALDTLGEAVAVVEESEMSSTPSRSAPRRATRGFQRSWSA
jgi:hypothetical protein